MGKDFWQASKRVKELFEIAADCTGLDTKRLLFEGSEAELKQTDKTQIAVTLINISANAVLNEYGVKVDGYAGFSLGEYSALTEAGVIKIEDLFRIVKARGEFMEKASRALASDQGQAGMTAILGLPLEEVQEVLVKLQGKDVFLANYNSPRQIVIAGTHSGLSAAEEIFEQTDAIKIVRLPVSGPFHTPLIKDAQEKLKAFLADFEFKNPAKPVYANVNGERILSGNQAKELWIQQVVSPVRWVDEEKTLLKDGYTRFLEAGPGSVLRGLWRALKSDYRCFAAGKLENIKKIVEE